MTDYVGLARFISEHVVSHPEVVEVTEHSRGRSTVIEVTVADDDKGKFIGTRGRNVDAIRHVMRAAGLRGHQRVQLELTESDRDDDRPVLSDGQDSAEF